MNLATQSQPLTVCRNVDSLYRADDIIGDVVSRGFGRVVRTMGLPMSHARIPAPQDSAEHGEAAARKGTHTCESCRRL